jgi:hypothetical protein
LMEDYCEPAVPYLPHKVRLSQTYSSTMGFGLLL